MWSYNAWRHQYSQCHGQVSCYKTFQLYIWERATKKSVYWGAFPPISISLYSWPCTQKAQLQAGISTLFDIATLVNLIVCCTLQLHLPATRRRITWLHSVHEIAVHTPLQLIRSGIGWNAFCTVGDIVLPHTQATWSGTSSSTTTCPEVSEPSKSPILLSSSATILTNLLFSSPSSLFPYVCQF